MKSISTLSVRLTVLVAALIGIAPMASSAADYASESSAELMSDSRSSTSHCSPEQSPLLADCATTDRDQAAKTTNSSQSMEGDYNQAAEQIDATGVLLEDLVKTGPDQFEVE